MTCRCEKHGVKCKQYTFHVNQHESSAILNALISTITRLESLESGKETEFQLHWKDMVELHKLPKIRDINRKIIKDYRDLINKLIVKEDKQ